MPPLDIVRHRSNCARRVSSGKNDSSIRIMQFITIVITLLIDIPERLGEIAQASRSFGDEAARVRLPSARVNGACCAAVTQSLICAILNAVWQITKNHAQTGVNVALRSARQGPPRLWLWDCAALG